MEKPCMVKYNGLRISGTLVAKDDFGMCSVRFSFDEMTAAERDALRWKGHNKTCLKVVSESAVEVTG